VLICNGQTIRERERERERRTSEVPMVIIRVAAAGAFSGRADCFTSEAGTSVAVSPEGCAVI